MKRINQLIRLVFAIQISSLSKVYAEALSQEKGEPQSLTMMGMRLEILENS